MTFTIIELTLHSISLDILTSDITVDGKIEETVDFILI